MPLYGTNNPSYKHGLSNTGTFRSWAGMVTRCSNKKIPQYSDYGGRGIRVCERWLTFSNFYADMGDRPKGKTLDRYPDNDGNYEPSNCRWATIAEQNNNSRHNRRVTISGVTKTIEDWSRTSGIDPSTLCIRLKMGWPPEHFLLPPGINRFLIDEYEAILSCLPASARKLSGCTGIPHHKIHSRLAYLKRRGQVKLSADTEDGPRRKEQVWAQVCAGADSAMDAIREYLA